MSVEKELKRLEKIQSVYADFIKEIGELTTKFHIGDAPFMDVPNSIMFEDADESKIQNAVQFELKNGEKYVDIASDLIEKLDLFILNQRRSK